MFNFEMTLTTWKVSKYGVFSDPYFPVFGLNTDSCSVNLRIQSEYWIIGNRKKSIFGFTQWLVKKSLKVFAASSFFSRIKIFFHQHYLIRVRVFIWKKRYDIFPIWFVIGNLPPIKIVAVVLLSFPNERRPIFSLFIIRSFVPIRSSS